MAATSYLFGRNRALKPFFAAPLPMSALGHKQTFFDSRQSVRFRG